MTPLGYDSTINPLRVVKRHTAPTPTGAPTMTPKYSTATHLRGALYAYVAPRLALDAQMPDLGPVVQGVTRSNFNSMRNRIAARLRHATHGRIALDADLSDILDLLDALEEGYEGEQMEEGQDRRRGRDQNPNGFGGPGYGSGGGMGSSYYGVNPAAMSDAPIDCTDPEEWERQNGRGGMDREKQEYEPWRDADEEENRRYQIANSTGSESIDARIRMNRDRQRLVADKRKHTIDRMRQIVKNALSASDTEVPGLNQNVSQSSVLEPEAPPVDKRAGDRRRMARDHTLGSRSRMLSNMRRISDTGTSYCPTTAGGSSPAIGAGASSEFVSRYPWAARVKI